MPNIRTHELQLTNSFLIAYRRPNVRLFRRNIINTTVRHMHTDEVIHLKSGQVGQADLYGYARRGVHDVRDSGGKLIGTSKSVGCAVPIEIELKGVGTPTSPEQVNWATWCKDWGVIYLKLQAKKGEMVNDTTARWTFEVDRFLSQAFGGEL